MLIGPKSGLLHPPKKLTTLVSIFWICAVKCTIDCALKHIHYTGMERYLFVHHQQKIYVMLELWKAAMKPLKLFRSQLVGLGSDSQYLGQIGSIIVELWSLILKVLLCETIPPAPLADWNDHNCFHRTLSLSLCHVVFVLNWQCNWSGPKPGPAAHTKTEYWFGSYICWALQAVKCRAEINLVNIPTYI